MYECLKNRGLLKQGGGWVCQIGRVFGLRGMRLDTILPTQTRDEKKTKNRKGKKQLLAVQPGKDMKWDLKIPR